MTLFVMFDINWKFRSLEQATRKQFFCDLNGPVARVGWWTTRCLGNTRYSYASLSTSCPCWRSETFKLPL